jgi:NADP-dependent alcohol dehydrogenase
MMHIKRSNKKDKILQYGARVWNITEGTENERIDQIIAATVKFFESVGIQTRLSDYDIDESFITKVKNRFLHRGMMGIGEHGDISPDQVAEILEHQL